MKRWIYRLLWLVMLVIIGWSIIALRPRIQTILQEDPARIIPFGVVCVVVVIAIQSVMRQSRKAPISVLAALDTALDTVALTTDDPHIAARISRIRVHVGLFGHPTADDLLYIMQQWLTDHAKEPL